MKESIRELRPVLGEFVHPPEVRAKACADAGHPLTMLNLSLSQAHGREIRRCHCGVEDQARGLKKPRKTKT